METNIETKNKEKESKNKQMTGLQTFVRSSLQVGEMNANMVTTGGAASGC